MFPFAGVCVYCVWRNILKCLWYFCIWWNVKLQSYISLFLVCSLAVTWTEQVWGQIGVMALSPAVNRWTLMDNSVITLRLEAVWNETTLILQCSVFSRDLCFFNSCSLRLWRCDIVMLVITGLWLVCTSLISKTLISNGKFCGCQGCYCTWAQ